MRRKKKRKNISDCIPKSMPADLKTLIRVTGDFFFCSSGKEGGGGGDSSWQELVELT